jgi:two-component system, NarL family, nitrate/nitrite response regulator NarL
LAISLVLADPHPIYLIGLEQVLSSEPDVTILARCSNSEDALKSVRQHQPDIFITNLNLPPQGGIEIIREIREDNLSTRAVILTDALNDSQAVEAFQLAVPGIVLKGMAPDLLVRCLRKVHAGGQWQERQSMGRAVEKMLRREAGARRLSNILTPREIEIVRLVAEGESNGEIAARLVLREGTVKIHLHNVYKKLGIENRVDLTLYAQKKGLV